MITSLHYLLLTHRPGRAEVGREPTVRSEKSKTSSRTDRWFRATRAAWGPRRRPRKRCARAPPELVIRRQAAGEGRPGSSSLFRTAEKSCDCFLYVTILAASDLRKDDNHRSHGPASSGCTTAVRGSRWQHGEENRCFTTCQGLGMGRLRDSALGGRRGRPHKRGLSSGSPHSVCPC